MIGALALALPACRSADPLVEERAPRIDLEVESYSLDNGLEVILARDDRIPVAAVNLWYHVGAADDGPGRIGFAHLFEHMMLQGSRHVPGDPFALLEAAGASAANGNTDLDRTTYLEDVPSHQLELALWLEADRMGYLLDTLDARKLAIQQSVVRNERRQTRDGAPYGLAQEEILRMLFPEDHPYAAGILGSHDDIQSARLEDMRTFFRQFYGPNNASLAIAGQIDIPKTKAMVEKYFGSLPRGPEPPRRTAPPPRQTRQKRAMLTDSVELPRVYMGWITPPAYRPGDAEATVAARLLGGGRASRLYERLVFDRKIAQSVSASQRSLGQASIFQIVATPKPGHSAQELEEAIRAEIDLLASEGPSEREVLATKKGIVAGTVRSLELLGVVADRLNSYNHYVGDPDHINQDVERYWRVTPAAVQRFVADQLTTERSAVVHVVPGSKELPPEPPAPPVPEEASTPLGPSPEPWRAEVPRPAETPAPRIPVAAAFQLRNGLRVLHIDSPALPLVTAYLTTPIGSAADPAELPGLAGFTAAMLDEGTPRRTAAELQRELSALGTTLDASANRDESWIVLEALRDDLAQGLDILSDSVRSAAFRPADVERVRDNLIVGLRQQRDDRMDLAHRVLWNELYGPGHPYAHSPSGTEVALTHIGPEELRRFHGHAFTPETAALVLVGDLSRQEARERAEEAFGDWAGGAGFDIPLPPPAPGSERVVIVDKPGSPQTALVVGQVGVGRLAPEYEAVLLMNQVLGGLFSSRLNTSLRQEKGYTYSLDSSQFVNRGAGPLRVSAMVDAPFTADAVREILNEVAALKQRGVSGSELDSSKESVARTIPALFQTNRATASTVAALHVLGLPQDHYAGRSERVASITSDRVAEVSGTVLTPDSMRVIAVGDRAVIEPQLRSLGLGAMGFRTPEALT